MPARWLRVPITPAALVVLLAPWQAASEVRPREARPAGR